MSERFHQYNLTTTLAKKYSHSTYLASLANRGHGEPEHQVVLTVFTSSLFCFPYESENLLQKAQRIKQLQHQHLVPILDMGIEEEQPFVVRAYLPSVSLRDRLKELFPGRLELREALTIVLQIGETLAYAHENDICHGNLKPENIFFDADGQAVLTDFSLMDKKEAIIRDQATEEYAFCYLAPEQFAGTCDARSDQYALGCLAYELITGRTPFATRSLHSMMTYLDPIPPAPFSESVDGLPPSLEIAILKALAKNPDERFFDFSLFLEVIRSVLSPPPAFPLVWVPQARKNRRPPRPTQSAKVESVSSPIRSHTTRYATLQQLETLEACSDTEGDLTEPEDGSLTTQDTPEQTGPISVPDLLELTSEDDLSTPLLSQHEHDESKTEGGILSLSESTKRHRPVVRRTWHSKKTLLGSVLLFSIIAALFTYTSWPVVTTEPDTFPHSLQKIIHVVLPQIPLQVVSTPSVQPSAQASDMTNIQGSAKVNGTLTTPFSTAINHTLTTPSSKQTTQSSSKPPSSSSSSPSSSSSSSSSATPTPTTPRSYEAEAPGNTLGGNARVEDCSGCSGGKVVGSLGSLTYSVQFNDVWESKAGSYTLTIYYVNGYSSTLEIKVKVNGVDQQHYSLAPTGSWDTVGTITDTISLNAGNNTITLFDAEPDSDRIVV